MTIKTLYYPTHGGRKAAYNFEVEPIHFRYLFHGTSSKYRQEIETDGLMPISGKLHVTTNPVLALEEARFTVGGDPKEFTDGYKKGVGGEPVIVVFRRDAIRNLRLDLPGYYDKESTKIRRLVAKRFAFTTEMSVRPEALTFIDSTLEAECNRLLRDIHSMAKRLPYKYSPETEERFKAERSR